MLSGSTSPKGKKSVKSVDIQSAWGQRGGGGTLLGIHGADSILRATRDSPLQVELTRAYYRLCRDSDRVGNRRSKEP